MTSRRIGITGRFQNSYFSGSIPQVAVSLASAFQSSGHDVTLIRLESDPDWFIDVLEHKSNVPKRCLLSQNQEMFDVLIEVGWSLSAEDRVKHAKQVFYFIHYPPVFHDMESSVYAWNSTVRDFTNVAAIMTYDFYSKQEVQYLEILSNKPVVQIPYIWDNKPLDIYVKESNVPAWSETARNAESVIPANIPKTMAWCARIVESNFSNSSSCVVPLNIVSVLRTKGCAIRFGVHNATQTANSPFFQTNVAKNLLLPDISGSMIPRVRLPDLCREKTALIAHQRFRPMKSYMLDALYLGIPMVHNCALLKQYGAPYFYELNQIQQAAEQWIRMMADHEQQTGFFAPRAAEIRRAALQARFSPSAVAPALNALLSAELPTPLLPQLIQTTKHSGNELRIAFANMWDEFQPKHNFFMYLLSWVGRLNNIRVVHDDTNPNLVFFGPLSQGAEKKYPGVPKVFFTGENAPKNADKDTFLNLGFSYDTNYENYVRLPLWVLELNWWGADPTKVVNPKYVNLEDAMRVNPAVLDTKEKFCAFVATNPKNQNRNMAFQILNNWQRVDSGGRLFCNLPDGPIPAGLGGGGGELAKIEFYKKYKFALTFENSSAPGYCTEKLFHAKVAGCVPIYWGDPFVDRDFDSKGFINVNQIATAEQLVEAVKKVAEDPDAWRKMAQVPALSEFKKRWCEKTMEHVAAMIFKTIVHTEIAPIQESDWAAAQNYATTMYDTQATAEPQTSRPVPETQVPEPKISQSNHSQKRVFVTAANMKYIESAINAVASFRSQDATTPIHVYVWNDVPSQLYQILQKVGATEIRKLPTDISSETPWSDFWEPQHFAWKLWIHHHILTTTEKDTNILYLDAGTVVALPLDSIWNQIDTAGIFLLDDDSQTNERWCHQEFCAHMKPTPPELAGHQITAGLIGYKVGHTLTSVFDEALDIAKTHRSVIVGEKWHKYSETCSGHRHDQSILSILTQRKSCPRLPLRDYYCDTSLRAARQYGTPLYVHRGQFKQIVPFANNIDEAYVINLERRKDRLDIFKTTHPYMKNKTYVWKATDGRALTLTPDIIHCFRNNDFGWKKAVMGCALSHLGLWEKLANDTEAKSYLILEDDVRFTASWQEWWSAHASDMPANADVVYLGGVLPPNKPAFPHIIEAINPHFGRVKPNTIFGGSVERRYFHFCNYAYLLTQSGAKKLVQLVKDRGIFTSGDHMIVNHGDDMLNIYFTTPLLATCFQEDDPTYQKSDFNNFSRVDNFDSDLWNNTDCFTKTEVEACLQNDLRTKSVVSVSSDSVPKTPTRNPHTETEHKMSKKEDTIQLWNDLLKAIALKQTDDIKSKLIIIFDLWSSYSIQQMSDNLSYFRVLEQLVIMDEPMLRSHRPYMLERIQTFKDSQFQVIFDKMRAALEDSKKPTGNGITYFDRPPEQRITAFHLKEIQPKQILEREWLDSIFPHPLEYKQFGSIHDILTLQNPCVYVFQKIPTLDATKVLNMILDMMRPSGKQLIVLHLSDEFGNDPIDWYGHPSVKGVIRNYWRPELKSYPTKVLLIPLGYTNNRSRIGFPESPSFEERDIVWSFAGSLDRNGRQEALEKLRSVKPHREECKPSWSSPDIMKAEEYNMLLQKSKFVPCMRGSHALESYRLYEALEHGAIPIYVPSESAHCMDEYTELYGKHPFLGFESWSAAAGFLPKLMTQPQVMEKHRTQLRTWWNDKKTELRVKLQTLFKPSK
jgi:GR25 family glycosyltransferase involved in LPS biosynthesis